MRPVAADLFHADEWTYVQTDWQLWRR